MSAYLFPPAVSASRNAMKGVSVSTASEFHGRFVFARHLDVFRRRSKIQPWRTSIACDASGIGAVNPLSESEAVDETLQNVEIDPTWRFLAETAIQLTVAGFAVAASVIAKTRFFAFATAFLSIPQVVLSVRRYLREKKAWIVKAHLPKSKPEQIEGIDESDALREKEGLISQGVLNSTVIRGAVAEEIDALRNSIEQMETSTLQREQARNRSIAEALASLDHGIRAVRRTVETRNQIESTAPFAVVAELENAQSRLKESERGKVELEVKLQIAQANFEEAKRQGERARREADEAMQRELLLRTEVATISSRLARLDEITERLGTAERRNDELREELISGSREQENLRQSAADSEKKVLRVENISRILRERLQGITGMGQDSYNDGSNRGKDMEVDSDAEEQFWQRRLRKRASLPRPGSLLYQELLGGTNEGGQSKEWPEAALEGGAREKQRRAQLENLPADGGFGNASDASEESVDDNESIGQLPSAAGGTMFSFSRNEFDGSKSSTTKPLPASREEKIEKVGTSSEPTVDSSKSYAEPELPYVREGNVDLDVKTGPNAIDGNDADAAEIEMASSGTGASMLEMISSDDESNEIREDETLRSEETVAEANLTDPNDGCASKDDEEVVASEEDGKALQDTTIIRDAQDSPPDLKDQLPVSPAVEPSLSLRKDNESLLKWGQMDEKPAPYDKDVKADEAEQQEELLAEEDAEVSSDLGEVQTNEAERLQREQDPEERNTVGTPPNVSAEKSEEPASAVHVDRTAGGTPTATKNEFASAADEVRSSSDAEADLKGFSVSKGSSGSVSGQDEALVEDTFLPLIDLKEDTHTLSWSRPSIGDLNEKDVPASSEIDERRMFKERIPVPTVEELVDAANELVKKARKRGLTIAQSDILFKKAVSKLDAAVGLGTEKSFVQAEFGGALLSWAKVNLADPAAYSRLTRALGYLSTSLNARPNDETTIRDAGLCLCLLASTSETAQAKQYYRRACGLYDRLLEVNSNSRIGSFNCGLAYISLGRLHVADNETDSERSVKYFETAAERFAQALELRPGDNKAQSYLEDCNREIARLRQE